jgi:hypothetical protein
MVVPQLGDNAVEGGGCSAPLAKATSGAAPGGYGSPPWLDGGARAALLELGDDGSKAKVVARFFWWTKRS